MRKAIHDVLNNCAKASQRVVAMVPSREGPLNGFSHLHERCEIPIMGSKSAREFPHALYRVQVRAVRWKEVHGEAMSAFLQPALVELGVVVTGIIQNEFHPSPCMTADRSKITQENKEGFSIELLSSMEHKLSIPEPYGTEVTDTFPCRTFFAGYARFLLTTSRL